MWENVGLCTPLILKGRCKLISHQHKCIFVRISKSASTSVLNAFKSDATDKQNGYFGGLHYPIEHYRSQYPKQFDEYFKFGLVRNPWARIHSQHRYLRFIRKEEYAQCEFTIWLKKCAEALNTRDEALFGRNRSIFEMHMTNQLDWLTIDQKLAVDFVGRFETLTSDFKIVEESLGIKLMLPHSNSSGEFLDYRDSYDDQSKELVAQWHSKDIEHFDYRF
tara:strand:- start:1462 stop:2121 length:660 start_codon:yes stop_codon:yes gene_type:complete